MLQIVLIVLYILHVGLLQEGILEKHEHIIPRIKRAIVESCKTFKGWPTIFQERKIIIGC